MKNSENTAKLTLRRATPADFDRIVAIQRAAYELKEVPLYGPNLAPTLETPETLAEEIADGKEILVGELDGKVVASLRVRVMEDGETHWNRLSVDTTLQGRGIGQTMMREAEKLFADAPRFSLDCGVRSEENRHIYAKLGYVETGETFQVPNGPMVRIMVKERR